MTQYQTIDEWRELIEKRLTFWLDFKFGFGAARLVEVWDLMANEFLDQRGVVGRSRLPLQRLLALLDLIGGKGYLAPRNVKCAAATEADDLRREWNKTHTRAFHV
jgi:hypothetical protein